MNESKHTPGPWGCSPDGAEIYPTAGKKSGVELCRVVGPWNESSWYDEHEALANARLITAAPKLLAACKWVLSECGMAARLEEFIRYAIDKAEGK